MADLVSYCNDIDQALVALKKGAQLLKYGRKGKPKFYPFRVSKDETSLIWIANSGQRNLKLASVSRIIPGQTSAVFQRPEKDYLSFSLIYNKGKRSLDLICKDKVEAEIWIAGLKALISSEKNGRSKIDGGLNLIESRDLSTSSSTSSGSTPLETSSPEVSIISTSKTQPPHNPETCDVASDQTNMQSKPHVSDPLRFSISSVPAHEDPDSLGDIYVWGEVLSPKPSTEKTLNPTRSNVLLPKPLECNVVLDVHRVACGVHHAALVTKQGEVFSWGEENGGRLGHGVGKDASQPRLVESLSCLNVDFVACGEFHTCAVTVAGEIYTWGDGTHNAGLLGHGTYISHWIPKIIMGPLVGLQVTAVACGPWHTALVTSSGKLFTFGEGSFGVLGHGDRVSVLYPKEVESLSGLRAVAVACGVWHTAAIIEVTATQKLFTWGDGDKNRLGQGDRDPRLNPTCVPGNHDMQKIACGHSLTVGLTTSGRVLTMGSRVYGQLGNPGSDGKLPCLIEMSETVEEISCGAYHVAVLTSRNEVYTWGKGASGSLGHGDVEDRKTPTLVEALRDKQVKFVACGSNYTSAVCLHKWVSAAEQLQCWSCRNAFGFTRKRHHCYNCGLVHCHACSSRKAVRAALAPNPSKLYRVCDSCFSKLTKGAGEIHGNGRRNSGENKDRLDKVELRSSLPLSNLDLIKQLDTKAAAKQGKKCDRNIPKKTGFSSRPVSRKNSPPRSMTPVPTTMGLSTSQNMSDSLRKMNEVLNDELCKLREQVRGLELREVELQKSAKEAEQAMALAREESGTAKQVIRSLTAQLKDMAEKLPPDPESLSLVQLLKGTHNTEETNSKSDVFDMASNGDNVSGRGNTNNSVQIESEWIEQYEPGVYITLIALDDGTRDLKRVRFSRRRFGEHQAEKWWSENREKVYEKYNVRGSSVSAPKPEGGLSPSQLM